jgi:hypothetical protein
MTMMPENSEIPYNWNCIRLKLHGFRSLERMQEIWRDIILLLHDSYQDCLIEDYMEGNLNIIEIFKLTKFIINSGVKNNFKTAIILNNYESFDTDFFDNVLTNRGFEIKHFYSEIEALNWLNK